METKIRNIVFYKFKENGNEKTQACIFYENGEIVNTSYQDGINACEEVLKERNITSPDAFREMINNEIVHCVTDTDFVAKFETYKAPSLKKAIEEEVAKKMEKVVIKPIEEEKEETRDFNAALDDTTELERIVVKENNIEAEKDEEAIKETEPKGIKGWFKRTVSKIKNSHIGKKIASIYLTATLVANPLGGLYSCSNKNSLEGIMASSNIAYAQGFDENEDYSTEIVSDTTSYESSTSDVSYSVDESYSSETSSVEFGGSSSYEEAGVEDYVEEYESYGTSGVEYDETEYTDDGTTYGGGYTASQTSTGGSASTSCQQSKKKDCQCKETKCAEKTKVEKGNNETYNECNLKELLELTTNKYQKQAMFKLANALKDYNGRFAKAYVEEGKDIKAALSFEEMVSLQQAYNNFTDEEIQAYFNGAKVKSSSIAEAYKEASQQLMGAYIIENSENALDMSTIIESEEGKEFYHKYHKLFLAIKDAKTESEKTTCIETFYKEVRKDFNFDKTKELEGYKLSVAPMIAAVEMMYQDFEIDFKLTENEIKFLEDIGLTKYAEKTFKKIENATKDYKEDKCNPTYKQYRSAIIKMLKNKCNENNKCTCNCKGGKCTCEKKKCGKSSDQRMYVVDNCHRNLAGLSSYQQRVNWRYYQYGNQYYGNQTWNQYWQVHCPTVWHAVWNEMFRYQETIHEESHKITEQIAWTETETAYREVIERVEKDIPEELRIAIDAEIECENERIRQEAMEEAEQVREEMQKREDQNAETIAEEIRQEEQDLQERIADANEQIAQNNRDEDPTNNNPVNESDLGHGVRFDDEDSDEFGNLDSSVENLTTDPTGNQEGEALPDPNETGAAFDEEGNNLPVPEDNNNDYEIVEEVTDNTDNNQDDFNNYDNDVDQFDYIEENNNNFDGNTDHTGYDYSDEAPTDYDSVEEIDDSYYDDSSDQGTYYGDDNSGNDYVENGYEENASEDTNNGYVEYVSEDGNAYVEYPEGYTPYVEPAVSNEEIVDNYVESMANTPVEEAGMTYSYGM